MMTTTKKGGFGPTSQVYLKAFEVMSEAQIARALKVSRQRIHMLESKFGVGALAPDGRRKPLNANLICPKCGGPKARLGAVCRKCFSASARERWHRFICPACGKEFARRQANVRVPKPACSRGCAAGWKRAKRGLGPLDHSQEEKEAPVVSLFCNGCDLCPEHFFEAAYYRCRKFGAYVLDCYWHDIVLVDLGDADFW